MSRNYCFTWFIPEDYYHDPRDGPYDIDLEGVRYVICQLEQCPSTGRLHFQGYAQFPEKVRYKKAAELLGMPKANFRAARGSVEENQAYCSKEATRIAGPWETGEPCHQGDRNDLKEACRLVKAGRIDLVADETYVKFHRGLNQLALRNAKPRSEAPHVVVYWGPTGTGKSARALELAGQGAYWHPPGQWWDGYVTGKNVVIDDFNPDDWNITFILRLLDRYPLKVPYKGGYTEFDSPLIIITSHFAPIFWWPSRREEIERRICKDVCTDPDFGEKPPLSEEGAGAN